MTDEELMVRLRLLNEVDAGVAADRIEVLVKERDDALDNLRECERELSMVEYKT